MIILASASPRRKMLLESAGYALRTEPADISERRREGETPEEYVRRISREKAEAIADTEHLIVAADTIVVHCGEILGKPETAERAREMLLSLRGDVHSVFTGVCIRDGRDGAIYQFVTETHVHFSKMRERRLEEYIATGEPMDKAGAYGIQGRAASFVERIEGSYTNVVGLPLSETVALLEKLGEYGNLCV